MTDPGLGRVWDALPDARVVGGAVRDALAGRDVADFDLATPLPPDAVMAALTNAGVKVVPTGLAHGTVTAVVDGRPFEITTLRRDVETDGRRAVVAFTADWQLDASRRDFTINAMSMTRDGTVFDDFGGQADLKAGRVRFVGDPATRIAEDYLRILRFFRFLARYGRIAPDKATLQALRDGIPGLSRLSVERVWHELRRILAAPDPTEAVALMRTLGIWQAVVPEATGDARLAALPADPLLRLAALLTGDPLGLATRLKLSNEDRDRLVRLAATPHVGGTDADLRRLLADHLPQDLIDRTWLDGDEAVRRRLSAMKRPVFPLEGRDVVALGVPAGPSVGALLRDVRQWWTDGGCVATRMACMTELARKADLPKMGTKR
ncbi:MAG TPA: CCA tRNA nucleotidyltransferase [Acetobacteraceae bacterium]|nr:CCA tRNA nucleotidyltransferase [Acetobacteraceae bacterium]